METWVRFSTQSQAKERLFRCGAGENGCGTAFPPRGPRAGVPGGVCVGFGGWVGPSRRTVSCRAAQYACALAGDALRRNGASDGVLASVRQLEAHLSLGRKREWGRPGAGGGAERGFAPLPR